jgi:hypothetical protein
MIHDIMGTLLAKFIGENPWAHNIMVFDFADWVDNWLC